MLWRVAMPSPVEWTSSTICPASVWPPVGPGAALVLHGDELAQLVLGAGLGRKETRTPWAVSARWVIARAASCCQRSLCAARPAEVREQATGTAPVCSVVTGCVVMVCLRVGVRELVAGHRRC
jgi:hypothetical protein